jgi:two-component system, OmpR family, sensor histidine kinase MtrB
MVVLGGLLLAVALVTTSALMVVTTVLIRQTDRVGDADARMRASLRTKVALLWYSRASDLAVSARSPDAATECAEAESGLREALAETRELANPDGVGLLDELGARAEHYISFRKELEAKGLPLALVVERATPALESTFADLDRLLASDGARLRSVEASSRRWNATAKAIGFAAAALLLVGFVTAVAGTSLLVERPLQALAAAMVRFTQGDEGGRATPSGAHELRQVAETFNHLADRLARQSKERLAFLAGVAHDLRNPLSALKLAVLALRPGHAPPTEEKTERILAAVGRQVDRLDRMVGDLLDATRVESGHLELRIEPSDVRPLVNDVVELFRPVSSQHALALTMPDAPVVVACDPARIEQVVANLLSNAIKYSPSGGPVSIVVVAAASGEASIAVSDQGMGIPASDRDRIFEPFQRSGRSRELVPGVGLGLSVARKIVEGHGGRLEVESEVGQGSTFRICLRALDESPSTPAA